MIAAGLASVVWGVVLEGTASADPTYEETAYPLHLKDSHHNNTWLDQRDTGSCGPNDGDYNPPAGRPYLWHFVVPSYPVNGLPDVTQVYANFASAGQLADGHVVQSGKGWNLYTATADTLIDAVGENGSSKSSSSGAYTPDVMNLSHTCGPDTPQSSSSQSSSASSSSTVSSSTASSSTVSSSTVSSSTVSSSSVSSSPVSSSSTVSSSTLSSSTVSSSQSTSNSSRSQPPVVDCCFVPQSSSSSSSSSSSPSISILGDPVVRDEAPSEPGVVVVPAADPPTPDPTPATSAPEVKEAEITRQLPQTGVDPGLLLMAGGLMLLTGVLLLRYSDEDVHA